ncbi:MAG: heavy metal translocating P-type ATPase, partial [Helicobacter sp.]|nr:heavy metal translocating P-type ATPase [Helicobacter sp.]
MKTDITLTLVHATKNRMRFAYKIRRGQKIAPMPLRIALESIEGISHVRINAILCQIILHASLDRATLEERLYQVLQTLLVAGDSQHDESYLTLRDEIPSASEVVRALTALCLEPFLSPPALKLAFACVAAFPVLASGCK